MQSVNRGKEWLMDNVTGYFMSLESRDSRGWPLIGWNDGSVDLRRSHA